MKKRMKRWLIFVSVMVLLSGCGSRKRIISLEEAQSMTEEQIKDILSGFTKEEIQAAWGEGADPFFGVYGEVFQLDGVRTLILYYESDGQTVQDVAFGENSWSFVGTIREIHGAGAVVEVDEGFQIRSSGDQVSVSLEGDAARARVGDRVKVTYSGTVMETYPLQLGNQTSIELIEKEADRELSGENTASQVTAESPGEETASTQEAEKEPEEKPVIMQNLNVDKTLFTETFYKAGDMNYRMQAYAEPGEDGDSFRASVLRLSYTEGRPHFMETDEDTLELNADTAIETVPGQNVYETELTVYAYNKGEIIFESVCAVTVTLPRNEDGDCMVSVSQREDKGKLPEEVQAIFGEYYPMQEERGLFERYLCRAELCACPAEELRLMRNTIYAAHGRKFKDPVLAEYMEKKPWYRGSREPESFSDDELTKIERENIRLMQELESEPYDERNGAAYSPENFEPAPYLSFLSKNEQTGLSANMEQAVDKGVYYQVRGTLFLPVTFTRGQWEEVKNGGKAEICTNELTGEMDILEYDQEKGYRIYTKGTIPDDFPSDIRSYYNDFTGLYELYQASDDTIMKPVYEGDLFILKGAVCGGMVNLASASELQEEITPKMQEVSGNCLYHNGKGYFTAVYYLGD